MKLRKRKLKLIQAYTLHIGLGSIRNMKERRNKKKKIDWQKKEKTNQRKRKLNLNLNRNLRQEIFLLKISKVLHNRAQDRQLLHTRSVDHRLNKYHHQIINYQT